jgi:DNA-binding transcriptional LysR family regulator
VRREHPGVRIDLRLNDPEDPFGEVAEGRADLALIIGAAERPVTGVRLVHLLDDAYVAVLPAGHPLAAKRVLDLADLAEEAWVGCEPPGPCLEPVLQACAAAGFSPDFVVDGQDHATARGFVAAGLGVAVMPRLALTSRHPGAVVRRVRRPEPVRTVHAAVRETALAHPAVRGLLDALREAAARH